MEQSFPARKYSLRSLILLITVLAPLMAWYGHRLKRAVAREQLIQEIRQLGGEVRFKHTETNVLTDSVDRLYLADVKLSDSMLSRLSLLSETPMISFNCTEFSDQDLDYLDDMWGMTEIHLNETRITDRGIKRLAKRHDLTFLKAARTKVTLTTTEAIELMPHLRYFSAPEVSRADIR